MSIDGSRDDEATFRTRPDVEAALGDPALVPPPPPPGLGTGSTARLRAAMARFSDDQGVHRARRAAVDTAVAGLDLDRLRAGAEALTSAAVAAADRAGPLPSAQLAALATEALARELDHIALTNDRGSAGDGPSVAGEGAASVAGDVAAVVVAIGRGERATAATDRATDRLLARFRSFPGGPVVAASLLYQNHDATAALVAATLQADQRGGPRRAAVRRTARIAAAPTEIGGTPVPAGRTVSVDLEAAGLEFGAGPHRCPGREAAAAIAAGMVAGIETGRSRPD